VHQDVKTKKIQQPYHFWLPLLCLFTGMRPGEACQLFTNHVEKVNDIWCMGHQTSSYGKALPKEQQAIHELVNKVDFSAIIAEVKPYETLDIFH